MGLLEQVMETLGFPTKFTGWILECVKTVNYTILVSRETTVPFDAAKGLRQGDPISPFLFAIVMEYLSRSLNGLKGNKVLKYHPKCVKLGITHLSFADDILLFARGNLQSIAALHRCFNHFSQTSGLQANLGKSSIYFGGVSQAQRATYWAQLLPLHTKVLRLIDAYCRSYIWSTDSDITKKSLVAWEKIFTHKSIRGLNLVNLQLWNTAAIAKVCWDLANKQDRLWIKWIHTYYIKGQQFTHMAVPQQACWMIRQIFDARSTLSQIQGCNAGKSLIRHMYLQLLGDRPRVPWKCLVFQNNARPKAQFTMWMLLQGRLLNTYRLLQ
ncbi:uncharacterized protein [Nicotiana tomentosiformis]|uniref:uncharacterized protein n=1 Tax=Nicotiana tomentosiformis TaxID=4098 RepID=UPI00388C5E9C